MEINLYNVPSPKEILEMVQNHKFKEISSYIPDYLDNEITLDSRAKSVILSRLSHCYSELLKQCKNKETGICCSGLIVLFENGKHFSYPVYETLYKALNEDLNNFDSLVLEQILREMFDRKINDKDLFYYVSERLLIKTL